jgi:hypothetical protein
VTRERRATGVIKERREIEVRRERLGLRVRQVHRVCKVYRGFRGLVVTKDYRE